MENSDYRFIAAIALLVLAAAIFLIGFVVITFAEISSLKQKGWLDEKVTRKYPIITNIVNILAAPIAFGITAYILAFGLMIVLTVSQKQIVPEIVLQTVFYSFAFLASFFCYFIVFSVVRLITTQVLAKSTNLNGKYIRGQSIFPAILLAIDTAIILLIFRIMS